MLAKIMDAIEWISKSEWNRDRGKIHVTRDTGRAEEGTIEV